MDHRALHARFEAAFAEREPPFAFVDLDALWANAEDLLRRAAGKPIRVASKSVRCRLLLEAVLARSPGFQGLLCFTLPEALWLWREGMRDLVVAYPDSTPSALAQLVEASAAGGAPVAMVDSAAHLDAISAAGPSPSAPVQVCIDADAGWWAFGGRVKVGPKRSPVRTPEAAAALAGEIARRPGIELAGLMAYEGQIAGVADADPRQRLRNPAIRAMKRLSGSELRARRAAIVEAVSPHAELRFVNGGGTGSVEETVSEPAVTEVAAGSGLYVPGLFDHYRSFSARPAAGFCLQVSRRPGPGVATALGGGLIASGAPGPDRLPVPWLPAGLTLDSLEGAGEVQTPLLGPAADTLRPGDRVYLRHAKAGELCERFESLLLVAGSEVVDEVPTYRGEGRVFV